MTNSISIGSGSSGSGDRLAPAVALADSGLVKYMAFDCLAERTLALAQMRRYEDDSAGYEPRLRRITERLAPFIGRGGRLIGNFGAANPDAGAREVVGALRDNGLGGTKVGIIRGDDVLKQVLQEDLELPEMCCRVSDPSLDVVSANAYIGAEPIVELLQQDVGVVVGGRLADPSLYVGPICHELGWEMDDWKRLGVATVAGHILECGMHASGANYADPPYRTVPRIHDLGFPFATISDDETIVVSKDPKAGGLVNEMTVKLQLLYEVHDPGSYLTPDVTADFSQLEARETSPDEVTVTGGSGNRRPHLLKVLVGLNRGWKVTAEVSYGGPGCVERAQLAADSFMKRLEPLSSEILETRFDMHGAGALFSTALGSTPSDVRLRVAARVATREAAEAFAEEGNFLYFDVAGGGGVTTSIARAIGVTPGFIPRESISIETEVLVP
ncbi:MAG TPA: acyclic terpene utilization AtuA family protein [Acidimicrobiales bacterium]|jgi:hypothetical protein|nr:acyclic terpene utilization AtuA family protein [Acidimicrobiales bacterium]